MPGFRLLESAFAIVCLGLIVGPIAGCSQSDPTSATPSPKVAPTEGPTPTFRDIAAEAGLTVPYFNAAEGRFRLVETMGSGIGLIDYDGDGRLDIFVAQGCPLPYDPSQTLYGAKLYRNVGNGKFTDVTVEAGVGFNGFGSGVAVGDYDGDGHDDLYLSAFDEGVLYRNNGNGSFTNATKAAGIVSLGWSTSCAFADLDGDGDLDLYVAHYLANTVDAQGRPTVSCNAMPGSLGYCPPAAFPAEPDALYRNNGDGTFTEVGRESGITSPAGNGLGLAIADWDDDGRLDLFVANDQTPNALFHNRGNLRFEDVAVPWGLAYNESGNLRAGMGIAAGDYDEDGRPDLLVTNFYGEAGTLYRNAGPGLFVVETAQARLLLPTRSKLGFGTGFLDYDNDGRLDLFIANGHVNDVRPIGIPYAMPPQLFRGVGRGRFSDVSNKAGPYFQAEWLGRSAAFGDIDNDGDTDLVVSHIGRAPALLLNETKSRGGFLRLTLRGSGSSRDATGAHVTAEVGGRSIVRIVTAGTSYLSASDRRILIGLGDADRIDRLTIRWPKSATQTFTNLTGGGSLIIHEGQSPQSTQEPGWKSLLGTDESPAKP